MYSYLVLDLAFLAVTAGIYLVWPPRGSYHRSLFVLAALLLLTAIFDNLIIMAGIVAYDPARLLGLYVGHAPLEDFGYAIAAAYLMPALWQRLERRP